MSSDLLFPLQPSLPLIKDEAVTIQNIVQLFYTRALENLYYPTMGIGLEDYIFENGVDLFSTLQQPIIEQIKKYVPEFQEAFIDVKQIGTTLEVTVTGKIPKYGYDKVSFTTNIQI